MVKSHININVVCFAALHRAPSRPLPFCSRSTAFYFQSAKVEHEEIHIWLKPFYIHRFSFVCFYINVSLKKCSGKGFPSSVRRRIPRRATKFSNTRSEILFGCGAYLPHWSTPLAGVQGTSSVQWREPSPNANATCLKTVAEGASHLCCLPLSCAWFSSQIWVAIHIPKSTGISNIFKAKFIHNTFKHFLSLSRYSILVPLHDTFQHIHPNISVYLSNQLQY